MSGTRERMRHVFERSEDYLGRSWPVWVLAILMYAAEHASIKDNPITGRKIGEALIGKTVFKKLSDETGVPYQNLINLYLQDCAHSRKKLKLKWAS